MFGGGIEDAIWQTCIWTDGHVRAAKTCWADDVYKLIHMHETEQTKALLLWT